ncbi:MAG: DUF885 domain-containing protein [Candidatus Eremiobacteraeota bacterium]|nr:DUF885 domain-containing protein [Candidatus Eremiobacteraeota bacterium]
MVKRLLLSLILLGLVASAATAQSQPYYGNQLEDFARRLTTYEFSLDPVGSTDAGLHTADNKLGDFSPSARQDYLQRLHEFRDELTRLVPPADASVHDQVNYLLMRANIEGAWWTETVLKPNERNPSVYEGECSNGIFSLLKKPFAPVEVRVRDAIGRLRACRGVLEQGKANLTDAVREFGKVASEDIASGDALYTSSLDALAAPASARTKADLKSAQADALAALHDYKRWVDAHLAQWHEGGFAVGKDQYDWYLRRVLLLPYTSEQVRTIGELALARDRALEQWEVNHARHEKGAIHQPSFRNKAAFLKFYEDQTARVRAFIAAHQLVDVPRYLGAFRIVELPKALAPTNPGGFMNPPGVFDKDPAGFYFVPDYDPKNTSFFAAQARQAVLPVLAHEGIPGHFMQFSIAYHNPDYIRHVQGDGVFAEGWAFYGEEMLMRAGLYDHDPAGRAAVIHLMRHRATRIGVDVGLATGAMTLPQAIEYFSRNAGIDHDTAYGEGTRFAMGPGQAIDYLVGKTQIETLLGLVKDREGKNFSLRAFHDKLLSYGTVPYSTIRYEWLGDASWIDRVREPMEPVAF